MKCVKLNFYEIKKNMNKSFLSFCSSKMRRVVDENDDTSEDQQTQTDERG